MKRAFICLCVLSLGLSACVKRPDALAPVVNITSPKSGTVRTAENLQISGYALDDEGVRAVRVNGLDLLGESIYEGQRDKKLVRFAFIPQSVGEGRWASTIQVEDVDGRVTALDFPLEIDTTPPTLELTGVEGLADGLVRVVGVARDNDQVGRVSVSGTDISFIPAPQVSFSLDVAREGLEIVVTDQAGNQIIEQP